MVVSYIPTCGQYTVCEDFPVSRTDVAGLVNVPSGIKGVLICAGKSGHSKTYEDTQLLKMTNDHSSQKNAPPCFLFQPLSAEGDTDFFNLFYGAFQFFCLFFCSLTRGRAPFVAINYFSILEKNADLHEIIMLNVIKSNQMFQYSFYYRLKPKGKGG